MPSATENRPFAMHQKPQQGRRTIKAVTTQTAMPSDMTSLKLLIPWWLASIRLPNQEMAVRPETNNALPML